MKKFGIALAVAVLGATGAASAQSGGTALALTLNQPVVVCHVDGATVTVGYTLSTTAASQTSVTRQLRNSSNVVVSDTGYVIPAGETVGGWTFAGRTKTHDGNVQFNGLADGTYTLEVCATQPGSGGNLDKTVCESRVITFSCADVSTNSCALAQPFGEVVGNTQIRENATAQIQFEGNFGQTALVEISGPNSFFVSGAVGRAGDSCNYHANWKFNNESGAEFFGNGGPGVYEVKVNGFGVVPDLTFPVTLTAAKGGN